MRKRNSDARQSVLSGIGDEPMKARHVGSALLLACAGAGLIAATKGASPQRPGPDTARIEQLTGAKGKLDDKEGVFKVSVPRTDLAVTANGVRMTPPMGLTCW